MTIQEEIYADIEWRNGEMAELMVILHKARLTIAQRNTYLRYIVPAFYAFWEGFVKNSMELYSKEINRANIPITLLHENLLTHAITSDSKLALDKGRTQFNTQKEFSLYICQHIKEAFPVNNRLQTKSNINFEVLTDILNRFNLGTIDKKMGRKLNKLLMFRNTIAHGDNSIPIKESDIDEFKQLVQDFMLIIFNKIDFAVTNKTYLRPV